MLDRGTKMQDIIYKVKSYVIEFFGNSEAVEDHDLRARILLFSDDVKGVAAELFFYQSQKLWVKMDALHSPSSTRPTLLCHLSTEEIVPVLDSLRHEKPIYIAWTQDEQRVSLRTYFEPVGEDE
jgi:hypothetical protein